MQQLVQFLTLLICMALLCYCIQIDTELHQLENENARLRTTVVELLDSAILYDSRIRQTEQKIDEIQDWRVMITIATRMGWAHANRYIASQMEE